MLVIALCIRVTKYQQRKNNHQSTLAQNRTRHTVTQAKQAQPTCKQKCSAEPKAPETEQGTQAKHTQIDKLIKQKNQ